MRVVSPQGTVVNVPDRLGERLVSRGWKASKPSKPAPQSTAPKGKPKGKQADQ